MSALWKGYTKLLTRFPVALQATQTGVLMATGDLIAQTVIEKRSFDKISLLRTAQFGVIGLCIVGPTLRVWYGFLDRKLGTAGRITVLKKVALDQLMFAPFFIVVILSSIGFVQGQPAAEVKERLLRDYPDVLKNNYKLWPAVQLCNFFLVPLNYQVLVVQIVAIFWNTYISWKSNRALNSQN